MEENGKGRRCVPGSGGIKGERRVEVSGGKGGCIRGWKRTERDEDV